MFLWYGRYFHLTKFKAERRRERKKQPKWDLQDEATREKIKKALKQRTGPYAAISDAERKELLGLLSALVCVTQSSCASVRRNTHFADHRVF